MVTIRKRTRCARRMLNSAGYLTEMRIALLLLSLALPAAAQRADRNVILVVTDGVRWQEVFTGADSAIVFGDARPLGGDTAGVRSTFWRRTTAERRAELLPFLWGTVARQGQIFGNRALGSSMVVTNGFKFSYPGYNEMLVGVADPRIDRNDYGVNPNVTVFEWLNGHRALRGRVAAFATWDAFADIFARDRAGIHARVGWEPPYPRPRTAADSQLNRLYATTIRMWGNNAYDSFMHNVALKYLTEHRPRVVFIGYGETDEWAHAGRYDRTLISARQVDAFLAELWAYVQSDPHYRGKTTMIVTTDHGRGRTTTDWTSHGKAIEGAEEVWLAVIGPDTPALGERSGVPEITQAQIAATVAAALHMDYRAKQPSAAAVIDGVFKRP